MRTTAVRARSAAVVAYHSSPLLAPGSGDAGGMTIYVRAVAEALARRGWSTDIYTRAVDDGPSIRPIGPGVRVVSIEAGPLAPLPKDKQTRYTDDFAVGVRAFAIAQRLEYDVVHSHYWQSGLAGIELARAWNVPLVHSQHTLGLVKNRSLAPGDRPEPEIRIAGERRVIASADLLVASTDDEWHQLACMYGAAHDRIVTVHPGVDHTVFTPGDRRRARAALGLPADDVVLLSVGRVQRLKGLELAVGALGHLTRSLDRRVVLVVVGGRGGNGDEEAARLHALAARLGVAGDIRFEGPLPHHALSDYYRAADVLLMCSHSESFGLAALEAHACGTPVVATAVGGLSHIVDDGVTGALVASRDPRLFADTTRAIVAGRAMSDTAVARAARFSWGATADAFVALYECLVRGRAPDVCTC